MLAALRRFASTAVGLAQTRLELLAAELDEERARLFKLLLLAAASMLFLALGLVTVTFFVILLAWDTNRILAAGLLGAAYLGIGVALALNARSVARAGSRLFSASLAELRKDRDALG